MRYLKFGIAGLLVLFILLTTIGLLIPSTVTVIRSISINAPADSVRRYTNDLAYWRYWINGATDENFKKLTATTNTKKSKILLGTYTVTVLNNEPDIFTTLWKSANGRQQTNYIQLYNANPAVTTVTWSFQQKLNWYPWERLGAMMHDKVFGPSMEVSLAKLNQVFGQ